MNINPISFGRTVKVNAPYGIAEHAANLVNDINVSSEEKEIQRKLKTLFFDRSKNGQTQVINYDSKTSYILSGEESERANALRTEMIEANDAAEEFYGAGSMLEIAKETHADRYEDLIKLLISETEDGTELGIEYDKDKKQIKSINLTI